MAWPLARSYQDYEHTRLRLVGRKRLSWTDPEAKELSFGGGGMNLDYAFGYFISALVLGFCGWQCLGSSTSSAVACFVAAAVFIFMAFGWIVVGLNRTDTSNTKQSNIDHEASVDNKDG